MDMQEISEHRRVLMTKLRGLVVARLASPFPPDELPKGLKIPAKTSFECSSIYELKIRLKKLGVAVDEKRGASEDFRKVNKAAVL